MKYLGAVIIAFLFLTGYSYGQSLEQVLRPFLSFKTLTYKDYTLEKDFFGDEVFTDTIRASFDFSGRDSILRIQQKANLIWRNSKKLIDLDYRDSTYRIKDPDDFLGAFQLSFVDVAKHIMTQYPAAKEIIPSRDSTIDGVSYHLYRFVALDSIRKGKNIYDISTLLVDKNTLAPTFYRNESAGFIDGSDTYITYFKNHKLVDICIDDKRYRDISDLIIPDFFKTYIPPKRKAMLEGGTISPELTYFDQHNNELNIQSLKGKIILLNISSVGCPACINSINMLNEIVDKYDGKDVVILSIYPLDTEQKVANMSRKFNLRYPYFKNSTNTKGQLKKYEISGYPTFYLIDRESKVIKGYLGYSAETAKQIQRTIEESIL